MSKAEAATRAAPICDQGPGALARLSDPSPQALTGAPHTSGFAEARGKLGRKARTQSTPASAGDTEGLVPEAAYLPERGAHQPEVTEATRSCRREQSPKAADLPWPHACHVTRRASLKPRTWRAAACAPPGAQPRPETPNQSAQPGRATPRRRASAIGCSGAVGGAGPGLAGSRGAPALLGLAALRPSCWATGRGGGAFRKDSGGPALVNLGAPRH